MNHWYAMNLGDGMMAWEPLETIRRRFEETYPKAGRGDDTAVFSRHASEGRLHCEVIVYFSPAAQALARALGAEVAPMPAPDGLDLLVGAEASWSVLFPQLPTPGGGDLGH